MGIFNIFKGIAGTQMIPKVSNLEKKNTVRVNVRPAANAVPIQVNTPTPTTSEAARRARSVRGWGGSQT